MPLLAAHAPKPVPASFGLELTRCTACTLHVHFHCPVLACRASRCCRTALGGRLKRKRLLTLQPLVLSCQNPASCSTWAPPCWRASRGVCGRLAERCHACFAVVPVMCLAGRLQLGYRITSHGLVHCRSTPPHLQVYRGGGACVPGGLQQHTAGVRGTPFSGLRHATVLQLRTPEHAFASVTVPSIQVVLLMQGRAAGARQPGRPQA